MNISVKFHPMYIGKKIPIFNLFGQTLIATNCSAAF